MTVHNSSPAEAVDETPVFEFSASWSDFRKRPRSAEDILFWMRSRQRRGLSPLPDGYVPPPGIDIAELLKQLPERYRPKPT
jgi:hypothetical protein